MNTTQQYYNKAKKIIPGGTQLLSKRPELFLPDHWPAYYSKANGCEVWDLDNVRYIDMSTMGIGSCIIGYGDNDINAAVKNCIDNGNMSSLNSSEEVDLATALCDLHPWADMVRYARTGGEAMAVAVRIARAHTGKDIVLFCGYHGWHDWYLSANLADDRSLDGHLLPGLNPRGVPRALKGTAFPFNYNDTKSFIEAVEKNRDQIGAIVLESIRNSFPEKGFIERVRQVASETGSVLIVDEISAGWRLNLGGAHLVLGIDPDIAVFAKGMSNGFPMAAIIGKHEVMEAAQDTFISSTYWTDRLGPVAALATIQKMRQEKVPEHLDLIGVNIRQGWARLAQKHDLNIAVSGINPMSHFIFQYQDSLVLKTLFTQLMLERGFLASTSFYASFAHKESHVKNYLDSVDDVFGILVRWIREGNPELNLKGRVCHTGFKRLT